MKKQNSQIAFPQGVIPVYAAITGPKGTKTLKLALDTGATYTMVPIRKAMEIGHDECLTQRKMAIFTASGTEYVPMVSILSFKCMGQEVTGLDVVCHDLPPQSTVDGLLGLNFLVHVPAFRAFYRHIQSFVS